MRELENLFSPEFRNRFSNIIRFNYLSKAVVSEIIKNKFSKIIDRLKKKNINLTIDSKIQDFIIEKKYNYLMGARIIDRIINDEINLKLAKFFLNNRLEKNPIKKILLQMGSMNNVDEIDVVLE
jgi:ATP-dependent Clp protease ATP-binding subunit ClpA